MTVLTEGRHPGEFIMTEANGQRSREAVTIAAEQAIEPGYLLSKLAIAAGAVAISQAFAGTGNGVLTFSDPAYNTKVKDGDYTVTCFEAAADGGKFNVEDPSGKNIGTATVGAAFNKEIKFTIADGATDFVVGDTFTVSVAADAEDYQYAAYDPAGTDGSEEPSAIAIYGVTTGEDETADIAAITDDAEVNGHCLAWPSGITASQKADAIQSLNRSGIKVRN